MKLHFIRPGDPPDAFPTPEHALREPDGLLAVGGDLSVARLVNAYARGIFPWYSEDEPIMWWSPDPRAVLLPAALKISRSLRKRLRRADYRLSFDKDFRAVMRACAQRPGVGTWITTDMQSAYCALHAAGFAHSVEVWRDQELVGGLYGIAVGQTFFGESMFTRATDASKVALVHLVAALRAYDYRLIDCQQDTAHLRSMGASTIPRAEFLQQLATFCDPTAPAPPFPHQPLPEVFPPALE